MWGSTCLVRVISHCSLTRQYSYRAEGADREEGFSSLLRSAVSRSKHRLVSEENVRKGITISEGLPSLGICRGEVWQESRFQLWNANYCDFRKLLLFKP